MGRRFQRQHDAMFDEYDLRECLRVVRDTDDDETYDRAYDAIMRIVDEEADPDREPVL